MIALSKRQHAMLELLVNQKNEYLSYEQAQELDQRPFRSMLIQKWVSYRPQRGFRVTKEGVDAWNEYLAADITRKNTHAPLTKIFDAVFYGLVAGPVKKSAKKASAA
jgi:hypothetical protein